MVLPSTREIKRLHKKYAPTPAIFADIFTHCRIVYDIAHQLIEHNNLPVDAVLVETGCLLHDIGVYALFDEHGVKQTELSYLIHGVRGEAILKKEGLPKPVCRFASHHTGTGISKQEIEARGLPLPEQDYVAETTEEELVMYADKFHSKSEPPRFNSYEWIKKHLAKYGDDKVTRLDNMAQRFGVPDFEPLAKKYGHQIRK